MPKRLATSGSRQPSKFPPPPPNPRPPRPVRSMKLPLGSSSPRRISRPPVERLQCANSRGGCKSPRPGQGARCAGEVMILEGKVALVTGSTSGIGLAIARALAAEGAKLMLNGFGDAGEIEQLCKELGALHDAADLSDAAAIEAMMERCSAELGAPDVLVNNAGIQHVAPVDSFPPDKWDAIIAVNLSAAFHTVRAALPAMKARRWGRIVNIASAHALVASPFKSAYVAAKHGIAGFTKTVALEVAEHGITVNAICPGYVLTPLVEKQIPDTAKARGITEEQVKRDVLLAAQPTKRFVAVEEVAGIATFLCSPAAASVTGALLTVDGGWTAQ